MSVNSLQLPFNPLAPTGDGVDEQYTAALVRTRIREIIGSYHHRFDHLYECAQNAVDACEKMFAISESGDAGYLPEVSVVVDVPLNKITIADNGVGMSRDEVRKYYFTPNATLKALLEPEEDEGIRQRGEKGVGATFLAYGCDFIHVSTVSRVDRALTSGRLENGRSWCFGKQALLPMPQVEPCPPHEQIDSSEHGTAVTVEFSKDTNMACLADHGTDWHQWEAILRLYTAVGYVDFQATDAFFKALRVILTLIDGEGRSESRVMKTGFLYPHLVTKANVELSSLVREKGRIAHSQREMNVLWEEFTAEQVSRFVIERMDAVQYMRYREKDAFSSILHDQQPEAYVAFTYGSSFWEEANHSTWGTDIEGQFGHGMVFATKSQRIGEQRRIDFRFRSGDFNRFFILLNMRDLKSDIGRKSFPEEYGRFANFLANAVQRKFTENDDCLKPSPGPFEEGEETELEQIRDSAYDREPLALPGLHLTKLPREEQDVVALFFDLLGAGFIRGYEVYSTHISRKYDGVGRFALGDDASNYYTTDNRLGIASDKFRSGWVRSQNRCFIEFKLNSDALVDDVRAGRKRLQDIKWLICWEVGRGHADEGIALYDITEPAQVNQRDYHGVTHLMAENQDKVYVICLQKVLEILQRENLQV